MQIKVYSGITAETKENETIFFIQNKGFHSGRPLKKAIPNCWEVRTTRSIDFEILSIVFESKILETFIIGSVVPFIRLSDYKNVINPILENAIHENRIINEHYLGLRAIEQKLENGTKIKKLLQEMKITLSNEALKKIREYENTNRTTLQK